MLLALGVAWADKGPIKFDRVSQPRFGPENDPSLINVGPERKALIYLNDSNFEHLTQAASGSTTGDWFVMFAANWCTYCREVLPQWNITARELNGEVNVAVLEESVSRVTIRRLNVTAFPTLIFIRNGRAYEFKGNRSWKDMVTFVRLEYQDASSFEIPPEPDMLDHVLGQMDQFFSDAYSLYFYQPLTFFFSIIFGVLFGCVLPYGYILSAPMDPNFAIPQRPNKSKDEAPITGTVEMTEDNTDNKEQKVHAEETPVSVDEKKNL